ncbi:MAG TPA: MoaF N-terminal domain-containing protein, partial [Thermodesulfobacteriota bacterium]|nr:MoaF N-terminal domain-containing protein [Thermodesulfobacteriota bacterium]
MPQQEGTTDYKYEDYASEMALHRLPQTAALVNKKMKITLDSGTCFDLDFIDRNKITWQSDNERGTDWCEVLEVAPQTYFIDMTFANQPRQSQTFIVNTQTRQVLAVRTIMREGDVGKETRAVHEFSP